MKEASGALVHLAWENILNSVGKDALKLLSYSVFRETKLQTSYSSEKVVTLQNTKKKVANFIKAF